MTDDLQNAVKAVKADITSNNTRFTLTMTDWRFVMVEELTQYFVREKNAPIFLIYDFATAYNSHLIVSSVLNELIIDASNIDASVNGQPHQGRYLICYYSGPIELVGQMATFPKAT